MLKERIIQFIDHLGIETRKFEVNVGLSNGFVSHIGDNIRKKSMDLILNNYPELNRNWVLTGAGEMLNENYPVGEPFGEYQVKEIIEPDRFSRFISPEHAPIPVYDDTNGVHNIEELLSNEAIKPLVVIMKGHLSCDVVVRHNDAAMDKDFIQDGYTKCQLGIQRVHNFKKMIIPGMAAIIMFEEFTITRYVFTTQKNNEFLLRSADLENFPDIIVEREDVKQMWNIKSITPVVYAKILMY